jgi:hypothetical protein
MEKGAPRALTSSPDVRSVDWSIRVGAFVQPM